MRTHCFAGILFVACALAVEQLKCPTPLGAEKCLSDQLGSRLSAGASIILPSSPLAGPLLARATAPRISPGFAAIVEVATESDVQQTIEFANRHGMPFLAVSTGHGFPSSLNKIQNGIQINMRKLNHTILHSNGKTASIGGGTLQYEVTAALFSHGKQTVTGICACVSVAGPLLGSGHGLLQGRYGFAADQLVSARVVLADGSAVDVSREKHGDLFWALRGAGHNFGVVTRLDMKTYDVRALWEFTRLTFTEDKIETLFETWNELLDKHTQPGAPVVAAIIARDPNLDRANPILTLQMVHEVGGPASDEYRAALRKHQPVADSTVTGIPYKDIHERLGWGLSGPACSKNLNQLLLPNLFARWDVAAMREGYRIFAELTADPTFAPSIFLLETYGNQGVRAASEADSAVAPEERRDDILMGPAISWNGSVPGAEAKALRYGERIRAATRGRESSAHAYVNYARGSESLADVYGHDEARLAKLKRLKAKYDPDNRFGFYMPIQ